jgi:CO/xanthine dehydrogenase Mo-binding subunit/aerobic-type carbon monoxide dehydrogenase small subunit (CoxS/CutS family)
MEINFTLNGNAVALDVDPARPLLDVLRIDLGLTGTKQGCDYEGECGACTVLLDGQPVRSCLTPVGKVAGRRVLTIEGLGDPAHLHPLQTSFIETGAVQCGYCTPGMILAAAALLEREPNPSREQIIQALAGNLCRCTGYTRIVAAVELAAARLRGQRNRVFSGKPGFFPAKPGFFPSSDPPIGGDVLRADSVEKVTGRAKYVEDIAMPGLLHARVLRSPHHHARLLALHTTDAANLPGVARVLTAADVPGENGLGDYSRDEPVLTPVGDTVKMLGTPVALVVATSPERAQAAMDAIRADYDLLPHTFDAEEALREDAFPIYEQGDNANLLTADAVAHGDLDSAFGRSDLVVETTYRTTFLEHAALERETVLGHIDEAGRITVVAGTHQPHWAQGYIASALGLDPAQVRVIMPPTGGSFGGKQDPWPLVATGLIVHWVRQPVRLIYSRHESFDASPKRHPYQVDYRIGATCDGHLTGIHVRISANTGGYDGHGQYIPSYAVMASGGPYRWQAVDARAQSVYTNGPKCGQFRGFGTPQSTFALECTLDELCQALDEDPLDFRLKNALVQSSTSFLGYPVAESLGYVEVLEAIRPRYRDFLEAAAAFNASADGTQRRGIGLAGMWYRFGKSGSLRVEAQMELAPDGHFIVYCSAPDYGQGTNTVMSQLAAEALGVSRDQVELINADTALTPDSGIQGASRATYWVGNAVCSAAERLKQNIVATAAELIDRPPASLVLSDKRVVCQGEPSKSISLAEVALELDRMGKSGRTTGLFDPSPLFPQETRPEYVPMFVTGAHLAEVTVDLRTGVTRVTRVVAAHDVGRAINPLDAQGQIEGAVVMGMGAALTEEYIPGASTGFSDYYLPTAQAMPEIEVILVEVPSYHGPFGAKGLGEASILPSTPSIINAVSRAIGARVRHLPATPERVLSRSLHRSLADSLTR